MAKTSNANRPLFNYQVVKNNNSRVIVSGPPTIMVSQPKYEGGDRRLSISLRVGTMRLADHVAPSKGAAEWTNQCIRRWYEVAFPQLALHYQAQGKLNMQTKHLCYACTT